MSFLNYFQKYICDTKLRVDDKVILITGSNTGIGYETAKELVKRGAEIHITCRSEQKCNETKSSILKETNVNEDKIKMYVLELSSFKSILNFVKIFKESVRKLDILICNAGVGGVHNEITEEGFELTMGVNYIGHYLLVNQLLDLLKLNGGGRIINVASSVHNRGSVVDFLNNCNTATGFDAYCNTKLANIMHTKYLAKLLKDDNIYVLSLHPGAVETDIWRHLSVVKRTLAYGILKVFCKNSYQGAQTTIYCAVAPDEEIKNNNGGYFYDGKPISTENKEANDEELIEKLWKFTDKLVTEKLKEIDYNN